MDITRYLNQKAVYWAPSTADKFGNTAYADGAELAVRWEQEQSEAFDNEGQKVVTSHHVFTGVDLLTGGLLWGGTLAEWGTAPTPTPATEDVSRIMKVSSIGNRRATQFVREAWA